MNKTTAPYKLSIFNWILAFILGGLYLWFLFRTSGINGYNIGYAFGSFSIIAILAFGASYVVWQARNKKKYGGTYTFNTVIILSFILWFIQMGGDSRVREESFNSMQAAKSELKEFLNDGPAAVGAYENYYKTVEKSLQDLIKSSIGADQLIYEKLSEFFQRNIQVTKKWQETYKEVLNPRILDFSILNTDEEFEYQLDVLKRYQEDSEEHKRNIESRLNQVSELFAEVPKDNETLTSVLWGMHKKDSLQGPIFTPWIDTHISYANNMTALVQLLKDSKRQWTYDSTGFTFTNPKVEQEFLLLIEDLTDNESTLFRLSDQLNDAF